MLVLSRHRNEAVIITIGNVQVRVVLVDLRGDKARLGFEAAKEVVIHREEIAARIDREALEAARRRDAGRADPRTHRARPEDGSGR
jgi:carbon storage regulator